MRGLIVCSALFAAMLAASTSTKPPARTLRPAKSGASADVVAGRALFVQSCAPCHGLDARGSEGPGLRGLKLNETVISKTVHDGVKDQMPAFGAQLTPVQIRRVTAYVSSLQTR